MTKKLIALKDLTTLENVERISSRPRQNLDSMKASIARDGLLNPLIVAKQNTQYVVLDGKKRLKAIRELVKAQKQTRAFNKVFCVIQDSGEHITPAPRRPALMTGPELAHAIITQINLGLSPASVAQRFECEPGVIEDAVSLKGLHPKLMSHFNNRAISLEQAAALATIPNPKAQLNLLLQLGPFVSNTDIIASIKSGATVIEIPDGNVVILPGRDTRHTKQSKIKKVYTDNVYTLDVAAA